MNRAERRQQKKYKKYEGREEGLKRSVSYFDAKFGVKKGGDIWSPWLAKKCSKGRKGR